MKINLNDPQLLLFDEAPLSKAEAIQRLSPYLNKNIRDLAAQYLRFPTQGVIQHKGWAGLTIEAMLGLKANSKQRADFIDWELKVIPLVYQEKHQRLVFKKEMKITQFQPLEIGDVAFEESYLFDKIKSLLLVCRLYEHPQEEISRLYGLASFDLKDHPILAEELRSEYEDIAWHIGRDGIAQLSQFYGKWLLLRRDGDDWYFYAKKELLFQLTQNLMTKG